MDDVDPIVNAAQLEKMSPQQRADVVDAAVVTSWDDVPESFRARIEAAAHRLGKQRRARA